MDVLFIVIMAAMAAATCWLVWAIARLEGRE